MDKVTENRAYAALIGSCDRLVESAGNFQHSLAGHKTPADTAVAIRELASELVNVSASFRAWIVARTDD